MSENPKIVSLAERSKIDRSNPALAKELRELADLADQGKAISIAGVVEYWDEEPDFLICGIEDNFRASGLLGKLQRDLVSDDEDDEE